jgi:hypothetical protein
MRLSSDPACPFKDAARLLLRRGHDPRSDAFASSSYCCRRVGCISHICLDSEHYPAMPLPNLTIVSRQALRSRSRRYRPQSRIFRKENCVRSPSPARRDRRRCPKCRPRPKPDSRRFRARVGSRLWFRPERPRRSSGCSTAKSFAPWLFPTSRRK